MMRRNIYIDAATRMLIIIVAAACIAGVISAMCGCTRTLYVPTETVRTEQLEADTTKFMALINSLREQISQRESLKESLIHKEKETVTLNEKGDTVERDHFIYIHLSTEERREYEQTIESQRDSINELQERLSCIKTDSVQVPYPVERKLTRWEQVKMDAGGLAIGAGTMLFVVVIVLLVWIIKLKRRR